MIKTVGKDTISLKRNLKNIFPKEFTNRQLINQFITYILNNFFEKSQEKLISAYVGEVIPNIDGIDCYLSEPTAERQLNQIIPIVSAGNGGKDKISYSNFIAGLHNDGCKILNENKLLSSRYWSWCPPINVDMFLNYNNYYWVKQDPEEMTFKVIPGKVNVEDDILGKTSYEYFEIDENGNKIDDTSIIFKDGMRVVFLKDTSKMYNNIPYIVKISSHNEEGISLVPVVTPLVVIGFETNIAADVLDQPSYTFNNKEYDMDFELLNGMRLLLLNDANKEYNNKPYIVAGVGDKISFMEDSYKYENLDKSDYIVMERGCIDGNQWSTGNRWVHRTALEKFNTSSMDASSVGDISLDHAHMPIICFNKNIELYDCGSFDRGYVVTVSDLTPNDLNGLMRPEVASKLKIKMSDIVVGNTILLLGNTGTNPKQLYSFNIFGKDEKIVLQPKENGQTINGQLSDGSTQLGDSVKVLSGEYAGKYLYYDGYTWKEGQRKNGINDPIKFNLYDSDKILLNNSVQYPNSTFNGCILFDYMENTSGNVATDEFIGKPLVKDDLDKNYYFVNHLEQDKYYYTPANEYTKEIGGYKFFRNIETDEYLNDWHLSENIAEQYIKTQIVANNIAMFDGNTYKVELKYSVSENSVKQPILVYKNGNFVPYATFMTNEKGEQVPNPNFEGYYLDGKDLYLYKAEENDNYVLYLITDDVISELDSNYVYDYPLSLTTNQLNSEFETIAYNNCFDQMIDIIQNQKGLIGETNGSNNYSSLKPSLSVGTKIIQSESSIIRTMILNNDENSSIRNSLLYVSNAYERFKKKFINLVNELYIKGVISDDNTGLYESSPFEMDSIIKDIISKINIGKEGLLPFYNNGVTHLIDNAYIPTTPAYLGVANNYEPKLIEFTDYTKDEKPIVLVGHDGSYTKAFGNVKDLVIKRFEELIYDSIQTNFKDTKCGINKLKFYPGKFRKNTYSREEYLKTYAPLFENWVINNRLDHSENINFDYSVENKNAWKTWNYTGMADADGSELFGSYRAIYTYYYDTHRPDTHPWEMLGFGEKPSWWETQYGPAPYTSNNVNMWRDIENGYIALGTHKGQYEELKRPGLFEKYLPVDGKGELLSPMEIGIIDNKPIIQRAKSRWNIGDMGDVEFAFMQTSTYRYIVELVNYLLRPVEWVETNWDTTNKEILFKNTSYEQTIDSTTKKREDLSSVVMHNELVDGSYVKKLGIQQWISDYILSDNLSISSVADKLRNASVNLGYRCAGYYQKGTVNITTDSYGELPSENVHINLFKSYNVGTPTYSGMTIEKTRNGYLIEGFDIASPYFKVKVPELNGQRSTIEENGKSVFYHKQWKDGYEVIPYRKEFFNEQDVYDVIIGYGKYLEEVEGWFFNTLNPSGEISNFRISASTFIRWSTSLQGEESIGNVLLLNPGTLGIGNYNNGMVEDMGLKIDGQIGVIDIYGNPLSKEEITVFRRSFNTYIEPKEKNIALVKLRTYNLEHLITLDNKTIFDDVIYNPIYSNVLSRMKISGVKVKNWYGDLYAPGYLIENDGAIPNFDKKANDLQYMFDVDDVHCQGEYAEYSKGIIGYSDTKTYKELFKNDKSMFDFYKGSIAEKGTKSFLNKLNRSKNISSAGNNIELFENWAFKVGEFGHTSDNSVIELLIDTDKLIQNPQIITFENSTNYYFDKAKTYNIGDIAIYNNHEYKCIVNNTIGDFNANNWEVVRFVGNYIIFGEDKKWLKKQKNTFVNSFRYTNEFITNPIGGFPMTSDCEYIVFDEEEFEQIKEQLKIGETVWIAKLSNGDWDVKKKTGKNKFISMRYDNLDAVYNQNEYDYIYHFKDNKNDYYSFMNKDNIEMDTPVYSDIDCNNQVMKWADVTYPMYTGNTHSYVDGIEHKLKLYNTIFTTLTDEDNINNGSSIQELNNKNSLLTYSNLLLNMAQFGSAKYTYKYLFTIKVDTYSTDVSITINGTEYKNPENNTVSIIVCSGDVINWKTYAYGCGTRSGTVTVGEDGSEQQLNIIVPMAYRNGYVISEMNPSTSELILKYPGTYEIQLVGAGGGAGGGSYKSGHKHAGNGGAGGAYLHGILTINDSDINSTYTLNVGAAGKGGTNGKVAGHKGNHGGDTSLYKNDTLILNAQGGAGAWGARSNTREANGRRLGYGGIYSISSHIKDSFEIKSDSRNGNNGGLGRYEGNPGESVYPKGYYGKGGRGVYKENGNNGTPGYSKVVYLHGYIEKDIIINKVPVLSRETIQTDSLEYSTYYQPYIIAPKDGKTTYFYSYDVLYKDEVRPNARLVSDLSKFYLNRSKSITAYHKNTTVVGDVWEDKSNKKYSVGDLISVISTNNTVKYYICENDNIASDSFAATKVENGQTIVYWKEYAPTYYYKITDNNMTFGGTEPKYREDENSPYKYNDYELYLDAECTIRAEKNTGTYVMSILDLDLDREYNVGSTYKLVDNFATYQQLKPIYLEEPLWSTINSVGNYSISSGLIEYFVKADKNTIDENISEFDNIVYSDSQCLQPIYRIRTNINGNTIEYIQEQLKYEDISNVRYENSKTCYEMSDGETLLYTNKPIGEISETDAVYSDISLENSVGVYGDYIPSWDILENFEQHKYVNEYVEIEYNSNMFTYEDGSLVDVFYKDKNENYNLYVNTSDCVYNNTNKKWEIKFNKSTKNSNTLIKLYTFDYITIDSIDSVDDLPINPTKNIVKVIVDNTKYKNTTYYKYVNNSWSYIVDILNEKSLFKQITKPLYVSVSNNKSVFYTDGQYSNDTITNSTEFKNGEISSDITLYYDYQAIGKSIQSFSIIEDTETYEKIEIMFNDISLDPIYQIIKEIRETIDETYNTFDEVFDSIIEKWNVEGKYVSSDEVKQWWVECNEDYFNYTYHMNQHSAKVYYMYRNIDTNGVLKSTFVKCFLFGDKFYIVKDVNDFVDNKNVQVMSSIGTLDDIAVYNKEKTENLSNVSKIVNVITYKEKGDYFYITKDTLVTANKYASNGINLLEDSNGISAMDGTFAKENKLGWMKIEYVDKEFIFDTLALERKHISSKNIKSCNLINNETDATLIKVQVFDPIQNIIPNNVLNEVNYISSIDPVNNYNDSGKWNEQKVGYLWWDTSKVRYVDYYQGDYEYKRLNWGKQLPGSEIAIMEWTKSIYQPTDGRKYITRQVYNHKTNTLENHYYYWEKNPVDVPNVSFRKISALVISSIINNPSEEGIVWIAPIDGNIYGQNENTLLFSNYSSVIGGQETVLQININSDADIMEHTEWVLVKENASNDIPTFLWEKMKDSLLGTRKTTNGDILQVPDINLEGRQRLGLGMRPRQTMFDKMVLARENFIDVVNDIFANRDVENINKDTSSGLTNIIDQPSVEYMDVASSKLEMMSWMDAGLIGKNILVQHDETLDGIWAVYQVEKLNSGENGYKLVEYQQYDISKYITYIDWYVDNTIKYITPTYTTSSSSDAVLLVSQLQENSIVKYQDSEGNWELWQLKNNKGVLEPTLVAQSKKLIQIDESIYDYVYNNVDNEKPYITLYKVDGDSLVEDKVLTKYEYTYNETQYILEQLIDYFNV